jgi:hypothetical protein
MDRCAECGFDATAVDPTSAADALRNVGRRWQAPLTRFLPGEDGATIVRQRPAPDTWSPLEYAAHVRDVFALFERRIGQIVSTDNPALEAIDHDQAVRDGNYNALDPSVVVAQITANADQLAATFTALPPDAWSRSGTKHGERRSVLDLVQRAVHEGSHHLLDAGRGLRAARGR